MPESAVKYIVIILLLILTGCDTESNPNRKGFVQNYQSSKPINFPHVTHSEIDCKYCHNSVNNSKNTTLKSSSVCLSCHFIGKDDLSGNDNERLDQIIAIVNDQTSLEETSETKQTQTACPCCGFKTIGKRAEYDICPICWWEDDGQDNNDADIVMGGPNEGISLTQARINYLKYDIYNPERSDLIDKKVDTVNYIKGRTFRLNEEGEIFEVGSNWRSSLK